MGATLAAVVGAGVDAVVRAVVAAGVATGAVVATGEGDGMEDDPAAQGEGAPTPP